MTTALPLLTCPPLSHLGGTLTEYGKQIDDDAEE